MAIQKTDTFWRVTVDHHKLNWWWLQWQLLCQMRFHFLSKITYSVLAGMKLLTGVIFLNHKPTRSSLLLTGKTRYIPLMPCTHQDYTNSPTPYHNLVHRDLDGPALSQNITWQENDWKLMIKNFGEEVGRQTLLNGQKVLWYLCPMQMLAKGRLWLESSILDRKIMLMDTNYPFPQPSCHCTGNSCTQQPWWQGWKLCNGSVIWTSTHHTQPALLPLLNCPVSQQQRPTLSWSCGTYKPKQ
jgi:hypothetical protein